MVGPWAGAALKMSLGGSMVIGSQRDQRGDDPAPVIGQLFGHPQGAVAIAKCEPEASFQLVGLGEEH